MKQLFIIHNFRLCLLFFFLFKINDVYAQCTAPNVAYFSANTVTANSCTVGWRYVNGVANYNVQYRIRNTGTWLLTSATSNAKSLSALNASTQYEFQVQTNCGSGSVSAWSVSGLFTTLATTTCATVTNITLGNVTPTNANITWSSVSGVTAFNLRYKITTATTWRTATTTINGKTLTSLTPGSNYETQIQTNCGTATSTWTTSITFTTPATSTSCGLPIALTTTAITNNSVNTSWAYISGVTNYSVRVKPVASSTWVTQPSTNNEELFTSLIDNTAYEWQVRSNCPNNVYSNWTTSVFFNTTTQSQTTLNRGPYLQTSTSSSIIVRWRTNTASNSKITYGTVLGSYTNEVTNASTSTEHTLQITGLLPATKYYYTIGSTTQILQGNSSNYFQTNPVEGATTPVRIWAIGDFGKNTAQQNQVRDSYYNYTGSTYTNVWLWLGDNAYEDGTDLEFTNNVFVNHYEELFKKTTVWPAMGNHDGHSSNGVTQTGPYFDIFNLPKNAEAGGVASGSEAYYSYNYANIHFICLESYQAANRAVNGAMLTWLAADLAANTQRWTIVYFHHPPYCKGSHNSDVDVESVGMRNNVVPLLENYKVDLVLCGHSHAYERSFLIKGHFGVENTFTNTMKINGGSGIYPASYLKSSPAFSGTVYAVCGVAASVVGTANVSAGYPHDAMYYNNVTNYGSLIVDVVGDRMDVKFLTLNTTTPILDQFTIEKSGTSLRASNTQNSNGKNQIDINVFPNPAFDKINIEVNADIDAEIVFTSIAGKKLFAVNKSLKQFDKNEIKLPPYITNGIYLLQINSNHIKYSSKVVVIK